MYFGDPVRDAEYRDAQDYKWAQENLPVCAVCGEPIQQDFAVHIGGDFFCDPCIEDMREAIC